MVIMDPCIGWWDIQFSHKCVDALLPFYGLFQRSELAIWYPEERMRMYPHPSIPKDVKDEEHSYDEPEAQRVSYSHPTGTGCQPSLILWNCWYIHKLWIMADSTWTAGYILRQRSLSRVMILTSLNSWDWSRILDEYLKYIVIWYPFEPQAHY